MHLILENFILENLFFKDSLFYPKYNDDLTPVEILINNMTILNCSFK